MTAIAGGTVSQLSGGKFANGAVSSAFVWMFNKHSHEKTYIVQPNAKQAILIQKEDKRIYQLNDKQFIKEFNLSNGLSKLEIKILKLKIHEQFKAYYISAAGTTVSEGIGAVYSGGFRSVRDVVDSLHTIIGTSGQLGFDYKTNSIELVGIYEIND